MGSRRSPHTPASGRRSPFMVGIVGRSSFYRQSLAHLIGMMSAFLPIDLGAGQQNSIARARDHNLDLVLIDLPPEDACRFSEQLLVAIPEVRPIGVLDEGTEIDLERYVEAGFMRFVAMDASFEELVRELTSVLDDDMEPEPRRARLVHVYRRQRAAFAASPAAKGEALSPRERQVLTLMVRQLSNKEIASELGIEAGTVKNHVHHILTKLQLQSRWDVTKRNL